MTQNADYAGTQQTKPHRLIVTVDRWGEICLNVTCPYTLGEPRPCTLYEENRECKEEDCQVGGYFEFGHGHPTDGCFVQHCIAEIGWSEAVRWVPKGEADLVVPADVAVWCDEDGVEMGPWADARNDRDAGA